MAGPTAAASGTFTIGADLTVTRLGYGAMQLTGDGIWGEPADRDEEIIREALHPYPDELVIATKAGLLRTGPGEWHPLGRPEYLRQECEMSLRRLGLERIDLLQLHRIDPHVPVAESLGALRELQDEGKIRHIGISEVSVSELQEAQESAEIVTVKNLYNLGHRDAEPLLDHCEEHGIGFIPWFPLATGGLAKPGGPLAALSDEHDASPSQLALAWLLKRSPVMLPIPGTSSVAHLEENVAGAESSSVTTSSRRSAWRRPDLGRRHAPMTSHPFLGLTFSREAEYRGAANDCSHSSPRWLRVEPRRERWPCCVGGCSPGWRS